MAQLLLSKSSSVADGRVTQSIICDGTAAHGKSPAISGRDKEKEEMLNSSPDETLTARSMIPLATDLHSTWYYRQN